MGGGSATARATCGFTPQLSPNGEAVSGIRSESPCLRLGATAGLLCTNYFQMEMARMISENLTFAALESVSVPITMRIAQDSNWA